MVILDTNVIIDHLRQSTHDSLLIQLSEKYAKDQLCLSVISVQELYEGQSVANRDRENALLAVITPLTILSYTYDIAKLAGEIARNLGKSHPITLADAAIAATTIINHATLCTFNTKDFSRITDLQLLPL